MSKFCTKCGKPLKNGKCENCDKKETVEEVVEETVDTDIVSIYKNIVKKPFTTIKSILESGNTKLAWILIAISSAISGLTTYLLDKNMINGIAKAAVNAATSSLGSVGDAVASSSEIQQGMAQINSAISSMFTSIFIIGFISMIAYYFFYAVMSRAFVGGVFKGNGTFKESLLVVSGASVLSSIVMVLGALISFISWKIGALVIFVNQIIFIVATVEGFIKLLGANKEKACYSVVLSYILAIVIAGILSGMVAGGIAADQFTKISNQYSSPSTSTSSYFNS